MKKKLLGFLLILIVAMVICIPLSACDGDVDKNSYCTVFFDTDGGSSIENQQVEKGGRINKPTDPTKDGYEFLGWYFSDEEWSFVGCFVTNDMTLTAKWQQVNYSVGLVEADMYAGSVSGLGTYNYQDEVTLTVKTNSGYNFLGWYKDENLLTTDTTYSFIMPCDNVSLTPKWDYYTVTVAKNDYYAGSVNAYNQTKIAVGTIVELSATTNDGYNFLGWFDNDDKLITSDTTYSFTMERKNINFVAKWDFYTILATKNDNSAGQINYGYETKVSVGKQVNLNATTNKGYNFLGWFDNQNNLVSDNANYSFTMLKQNYSFTAKWDYFTLTSHSNHNTAGNATTFASEKISIGEEITLTAIDYKNIGYIWKGWYCDDKEITKELSFTYTMRNYNVTFLAKWEIYDELKNFSFESTNTLCKITGVIDKSIEELRIPNCVTGVAKGALKGCSNLVKIISPFVGANVDEMEASESTLFGYFFGSENYLGAIKVIQDYKLYNSATYYIPESLKEVIIEGGKIFYGAFNNCSMITNIQFGEEITLIDDSALNGCSGLKKITIPFIGKTNSSNKSREALFGYIFGTQKYNGSTSVRQWYDITSDKTETYYLPTSLTEIFITTTSRIPYGAFSYCTTIKEITLSNSITNIGWRAFEYTTSLETVYWNVIKCSDFDFSNPLFMGSNVKTIIFDSAVQTIPANTFSACHKLENIILPPDSQLKTIGENAFIYCYALTEIYLPKSISEIGWRAFFACTALQTVKYAGSADEWSNIKVGTENEPLVNATFEFNVTI